MLEHIVEPIPIAGWLVLKTVRHVESFAELTPGEAEVFGPLTRRITMAMTEVIRPTKIYLSMYMEGTNAAHLHVHLIPRSDDTPTDRCGPWIFEYARESTAAGRNLADVAAVRDLVARIRAALGQP
ncbi:MAG: HIT family protein [Candidatus Binataceae bacterium]